MCAYLCSTEQDPKHYGSLNHLEEMATFMRPPSLKVLFGQNFDFMYFYVPGDYFL